MGWRNIVHLTAAIVIIKHVTKDYETFADIFIWCEHDAFLIFNTRNAAGSQSTSCTVSPFAPEKKKPLHVHSRLHSFSFDCNVFLGIDAGSQKAELEPTLHNCVGHIMNNSPAQMKS